MEGYTEDKIYADMERNNKINNVEIKPTTGKAYVRNIIKLMKMINANSYSALIMDFNKLKQFFFQKENDKPLFSDNTIKNYCNCIVMVSNWDICNQNALIKEMKDINDFYVMIKERINQKKIR